MGGGKSSTTTSQVSIPPEVLARYNAVNARAEQVAQTPFQPYQGQFVAGITPTQQQGIQRTSQAATQAQPYYDVATRQLQQAYGQGYEQTQQAFQPLYQGYGQGQAYGQQAAQAYGQGFGAAQPYYQAATENVGAGLGLGAASNLAAMQQALAAPYASQPALQYAQGQILGAQQQAAPANRAAMRQALGAAFQSQPYYQAATQGTQAALQSAAPYYQGATQSALGAAQMASPYYQAATQGFGAALSAGQPYQNLATQAALQGSQAISPQALQTQQYMSPYTQAVADTTFQALRQQQQQEMAGQTANAIRSGAFGGDRAGLAAANLARQQSLATAQAMAPIYQQGFGQALATAQQQQGVNLAAEQANRAAQQQLAQQALGIGQQGFGQELSAAQQRAALGQTLYGQGITEAQTLANLGQGLYGQQLGAAQQQAALGQALFGQGITGAQALSGLGQTQYGQALGAGTAAGQLGQQLYGQGAAQAQLLSGLGQTGFQQQLAAAQQQQALGQGLAGLGTQYGQSLQGLGAQQAQLGQATAAQQAALAQQGYGMGAGTAQAMAGLGTGAQAAALQGAQAQIGAGTLEQQTQQADLTARYQQFLQERGYPFQVAQFLANIAMGTGALSGSTTTTQQPAGFFSDERLKEDAQKIGETNDGQPIYRFRYKGDPRYQIGLMAQDVAQEHPEAVGKSDGYLTVDYKVATDDAVKRAEGGVVPSWMGGAVDKPGFYAHGGLVPREGYAAGSTVQDSDFMRAILKSQLESFGPFGAPGVYGGAGAGTPGAKAQGYVPSANLPTSKLVTASPVGGGGQRSGLEGAAATGKSIAELLDMGEKGYARAKKFLGDDKKAPPKPNTPVAGGTTTQTTQPAGAVGGATQPSKADMPSAGAKPVSYESGEGGFMIPGGQSDQSGVMPSDMDSISVREVEPEDIFFAAGGVVPRQGYAGLGKVIDPYEQQNPAEGINAYIEDAAESQEDTSDDKLPGSGGGGGGKGRSGLDTVKDIAGIAGTAVSLGKTAASAIPAILSVLPFSDERLKDNIEKVGKLNDGQNVYRYDFGNGRTQLGLLAQEVLKNRPEAVGKRDGYLTVDYDKATEGAIKRAMGGLARQGYATEGEVEENKPQLDYDEKRALDTLKRIESGNYGQLHKEITYKSGEKDRAYGAYGVMGKNIPVWTEKHYGQRLTPDEFLKNPEAQDIVAAREFGSYVKNRGNVEDAFSMWHSGVPLETARAQKRRDINMPTTAYVDRAMAIYRGDQPAPSGRSQQAGQADMPSEGAEPVQYAGNDASSGFSIPGGKSFWVPALSMVGSMLASRNPTLGGAIGEGIVGGVAGYQAQQKLTADLAKSVLDIVKDRFNVTTDQRTGETRYFNKNTGELLTPGQFKQVVGGMSQGLGVDPAILGISPPAAPGGFQVPGGTGERTPMIPARPGQAPGAPAAPGAAEPAPGGTVTAPTGQPTAPAEQPQQPDLTRMNKAQLEEFAIKNPSAFGLKGERDPNYLSQEIAARRQRALNATNQGDTAEAARLDAEAQELQRLKNNYLSEAVDLQYKTNLELKKAQTEGYNEYKKETLKRSDMYDVARGSLKRLADIYANYSTSRAEELKTQVTDFLSGMGFDIFDRAYQNADFDEAMKIALTQAFKIVDQNGLTRAPGAAMENSVKTVPAPTLSNGAAYMLIGRALGELDYYKTRDKNFLNQPPGTDPAVFLANYSDKFKEDSLDNYIRKAFEKDVPPGPKVTRETIEGARRTYGFDLPAGARRPQGAQTQQQQQQQPAAPAIPEPLRGMEGLVFSPSRNQYRDAQGNIYDATGRRVQ